MQNIQLLRGPNGSVNDISSDKTLLICVFVKDGCRMIDLDISFFLQVSVFSECCKGSISLIGKGGAVRVQRGAVAVEACTFVNNTARLLGGAIFVDEEGNLTIVDSQFSNSPLDLHSSQGESHMLLSVTCVFSFTAVGLTNIYKRRKLETECQTGVMLAVVLSHQLFL